MNFFQVGEIPDDRGRLITHSLRIVFSEFYTHRRGDNHISFREPGFDENYIPRIQVSDRTEKCENDLHFDIFITPIVLPKSEHPCPLSYGEEYVGSYETCIRNTPIGEVADELISKIIISWNMLCNKYKKGVSNENHT